MGEVATIHEAIIYNNYILTVLDFCPTRSACFAPAKVAYDTNKPAPKQLLWPVPNVICGLHEAKSGFHMYCTLCTKR